MEVFIKVMNDERFSDDSRGRQEILMCLAAHSQYFPPVEIVDSISLPVEVNNSSKLNLPLIHNIFRPLRSLTPYLCPLR